MKPYELTAAGTLLWHRCRAFVEEQSQGEWSDKDIADDADKLMQFVLTEVERLISCANDEGVK